MTERQQKLLANRIVAWSSLRVTPESG